MEQLRGNSLQQAEVTQLDLFLGVTGHTFLTLPVAVLDIFLSIKDAAVIFWYDKILKPSLSSVPSIPYLRNSKSKQFSFVFLNTFSSAPVLKYPRNTYGFSGSVVNDLFPAGHGHLSFHSSSFSATLAICDFICFVQTSLHKSAWFVQFGHYKPDSLLC